MNCAKSVKMIVILGCIVVNLAPTNNKLIFFISITFFFFFFIIFKNNHLYFQVDLM